MRWALLVLGVVAAILVAVVLVGWLLPVKHRASRQAVFRAPVDSVFALIADHAAYPRWRTGVTRVEELPSDEAGGARYREVGSNGAITYQVESVAPGSSLVVRIADRSLPFGGTWTYAVSPSGGGTALRITEDGEVYNPVFRFVSRFITGHTSTIDTYLRDVGRHFGETP